MRESDERGGVCHREWRESGVVHVGFEQEAVWRDGTYRGEKGVVRLRQRTRPSGCALVDTHSLWIRDERGDSTHTGVPGAPPMATLTVWLNPK